MKAGIIVESSGKSVELKESSGIYECLLEHVVKETKAEFNWKGKVITPAVWHEILMFFKWTQDTEKSESQVRLFVHPEHGWMAWAFPQRGGTSMTTKELDNEEAKSQRAACIPEGYVAFGTVHHHCTMSAFQSGTDLMDEKNVDGLHITVGHLDRAKYDIHCRLYIKGHKFEPDMSAFWDIGDEMREKIKFIGDVGFSFAQVADKIARNQMCQPAPEETLVEKLWMDNYIVERFVSNTTYYPQHHHTSPGHGLAAVHSQGKAKGSWCTVCTNWVEDHVSETCPKLPFGKGGGKGKDKSGGSVGRNGRTYRTATQSLEAIEAIVLAMGITEEDLGIILEEMGHGEMSEIYSTIFEECAENLITPERLWNAYYNRELKAKKLGIPTSQVKDTTDTTIPDATVTTTEEKKIPFSNEAYDPAALRKSGHTEEEIEAWAALMNEGGFGRS